jgi:hypothetical protein
LLAELTFPIHRKPIYNRDQMSQYPSPYSPPPYMQNPGYYAPYPIDPLRPAKRAGLLMIILGSVTVLLSMCMAGVGQMLKSTAVPPELAAQIQQLESKGITVGEYFAVIGGIFLIFAITEIVLGVLVRMGKTVAIVLSMIGTSVVVVLLALVILFAIVNGMGQAGPQMIVGSIVWFVPLALLGLQLAWLIGAIRASSRVAMAQQQYQAQYWQYQQNMQAYGGYGQVPPSSVPTQPPAGDNAER